jgi:signal transduction histidine kinase
MGEGGVSSPSFETDVGWPPWADKAAALLPVGIAVIALAQRHAFTRPSWAIVWALVALAPWLLAAAGRLVHPLLFGAIAVGGITGLILQPTKIDLAVFLLVYLAGQAGSTTPLRYSLPIVVVSVGVLLTLNLTGRFGGTAPWIGGVVLAWAASCAYQAQQRLLVELRIAHAGLAEKAASEERQRIAREVHDVIAHSLTVTLLHIGGARLAVETAPEEAAEALAEAERLSRQSLAEIRQTVGLLKTGDRDAPLAPMPVAADIPTLVSQFASAGLATNLTVTGDLASVSPTIGLGLYRIAQESLTNVAKHAAGASADVTIGVDDERIALAVRNNGGAVAANGNDSGVGLTGMKERAAVLGGTCTAGPTSDGWLVEVVVPRAAGVT